jgi:hypothetical protein
MPKCPYGKKTSIPIGCPKCSKFDHEKKQCSKNMKGGVPI